MTGEINILKDGALEEIAIRKAERDSDDNIFQNTYAKIEDIVNGDVIAGQAVNAKKAEKDNEGNKISDTYVSKKDKDILHILQRNTAYEEGDIANSANLPSWAYLECTTAGISSADDLVLTDIEQGMELTDGSVKWIVRRMGGSSSGGGGDSAIGFVRKRRIERGDDFVNLYWSDPADTTGVWAKTVIVKQIDRYPENAEDGVVVAENTVRDQYLETPLTVEEDDGNTWYYRAFPVSCAGSVNNNELNRFGFWHYGIYIDRQDGVESTCVHQLEGYDNYGYAPLKMIFGATAEEGQLDWGDWQSAPFMPKPCMLKHDGTVDYYLDPDDYTKKADGTNSDVTAYTTYTDGEAMMEWSPVFMKVRSTPARIYLYFCSEKYNSDYECWSCIKGDGNYGEHFYTPIYEGYVQNGKLRSMSTNQVPTASTTMADEMACAAAHGTGWNITTWADEDLIRCLGVLIIGRLNVAKAIGYNCGSSTSALTHRNGSGNKKGMFFGHYTTSAYATKFFGMENWWGHRWRRTAGLISPNGGLTISVKMCKSTADGSTVENYNTDGTGYIATGLSVPSMSQSYIADVHASKYGVTIPKSLTKYIGDTAAADATSTTYYCDGGWSVATLTALIAGGDVNNGALCGLFAFAVSNAPSNAGWGLGASLSYRNF